MKYKVKDVIEEAVHRLSRIFPTGSLKSWDDDLRPDGDDTPVEISHIDCIDVLRLVRLLGIPSILPLVFYACCNIPGSDLANIADGVAYGEEVSRLDQADLRKYLTGRESLMEESSQTLKAFFELSASAAQRPAACASPPGCRHALELLGLVALNNNWFCDPAALCGINWWLDEEEAKPNAKPCALCDQALRKLIDDRREETWKNLGTIFDIPEWPAGQPVCVSPCSLRSRLDVHVEQQAGENA